MARDFSRRDAIRWAGGAAMATTFLPFSGKFAAWAHPSEKPLATRLLGRTGREVTTFGLAGGNKIQWDLPGDEAVQIVVKAVRAGMTYIETANNYFLSQEKMGKAFEILNLKPGLPGYDHSLRARLFIATKTALRQSIVRDGSTPMGRSSGGGTLVLADIERSLTQFFGDGKGQIPEGAYLDLMQVHHIGSKEEVDAVFEGFENPEDKSLPRVGALACLLDYRDGTNRTGLNPQHRKWIRHLGITGHESPAAHMYAIQRDTTNVLDTLLVAVNPNDPRYFCHQTNSIPVAHAKGMGVIGMKVFADGVMYGLKQEYAHRPGQSVPTVGQPDKLPYEDFIRYSLNPPGMSTIITGIGLTDKDDDPERDQLVANLAAAQTAKPLSDREKKDIEQTVAELHGTRTNFFQRPSSGFQPPQGFAAQRKESGAVRLEWHSAYATGDPIVRYEVYRRHERIATIPFRPQTTLAPFSYEDTAAPRGHTGGLYYLVRAVDAAGRHADTLTAKA
ncbi:MAG: aldo/keto reductase [Bryobacterales bacterium]|nr:aldo/keto reductase [Bryobacterales bacterium]